MTKEQKKINLKDKFKDKISLRMITDDFASLQRNGIDFLCPHIPPMQVRQRVTSAIVGGQPQEQIMIQKAVCNTGCPLFQFIEDDCVSVNCGAVPVKYKIEEIIDILDEQKSEEPKIINIGGSMGKA